MLPDSQTRGRLAPSPTGALHLGNARSLVLTWLAARVGGGWIELRIEDLDAPRVQRGSTKSILEDLAWLGIDWDSGPRFQADRLEEFRAARDQLAAAGQIYPCICSRRDIQEAASAPHATQEGPVYPGTCRGRFADLEAARTASSDGQVAWRFAVPEQSIVAWHDLFAGPQSFAVSADLGDFVVWKKDDEPAYQLAVVVDDARSKINQVVRGDDLLPSAARQILLYQALGFAAPDWLHLPLVLDSSGRRLAKRSGDTTLAALREHGVTATQLLQWVAQTSGIEVSGSPQSVADLLPGFCWEQVPREAVRLAECDVLRSHRTDG